VKARNNPSPQPIGKLAMYSTLSLTVYVESYPTVSPVVALLTCTILVTNWKQLKLWSNFGSCETYPYTEHPGRALVSQSRLGIIPLISLSTLSLARM
jgi:hypothetical protein